MLIAGCKYYIPFGDIRALRLQAKTIDAEALGTRFARRTDWTSLHKGNAMVFGIVLLVWGIALLAFGFNATGAPLEQVNEALTGRFSAETMIYLIGGAVSFILGLFLMLKPDKST
jgi:hypothetical protein